MYTISSEKSKALHDGHKFEVKDRVILYATDSDQIDINNFRLTDINDMYHTFCGVVEKVDSRGRIEELILFLNVFFLESVLGVNIERSLEDENSQIETFGYKVNLALVVDALLANEDRTKPCFIYKTKSSEQINFVFGEEQLFVIYGGWKEDD